MFIDKIVENISFFKNGTEIQPPFMSWVDRTRLALFRSDANFFLNCVCVQVDLNKGDATTLAMRANTCSLAANFQMKRDARLRHVGLCLSTVKNWNPCKKLKKIATGCVMQHIQYSIRKRSSVTYPTMSNMIQYCNFIFDMYHVDNSQSSCTFKKGKETNKLNGLDFPDF